MESWSSDNRARAALKKMADILELDDVWPVWSIMIPVFKKILVTWSKDESLRFLLIADDKSNYTAIADLEELRVRAKKIEMMRKKEDGDE